jgi:hypothetical protein
MKINPPSKQAYMNRLAMFVCQAAIALVLTVIMMNADTGKPDIDEIHTRAGSRISIRVYLPSVKHFIVCTIHS